MKCLNLPSPLHWPNPEINLMIFLLFLNFPEKNKNVNSCHRFMAHSNITSKQFPIIISISSKGNVGTTFGNCKIWGLLNNFLEKLDFWGLLSFLN